jgi:membrane protease YdiL (CAAX protease family)
MLRLLLFVATWLAITVAATPLMPPEFPWVALPGLVGALVPGWLLLRIDGRPPSALGFDVGRASGIGMLWGLALGVAVGLLAIGMIVAAGGLRWRSDVGGWGDWIMVGVASLWWFAIPAAAEEALLRGYPFVALSEEWGPGVAVVLTSVGFALLHLANPHIGWLGLANIGVSGLFLGALRLRTGGLWWPTGAHLGWNWAHAFVADVPVSGLDVVDAPLIEPRSMGPAWVSGGGFGPEGSALTACVVLAATAWTWRTRRLASPVLIGAEDEAVRETGVS